MTRSDLHGNPPIGSITLNAHAAQKALGVLGIFKRRPKVAHVALVRAGQKIGVLRKLLYWSAGQRLLAAGQSRRLASNFDNRSPREYLFETNRLLIFPTLADRPRQ